MQLYCRSRPWFQIVVLDVTSLEEVGAKYGFSFTIHRIDYTRSLKYRVAKLRAAMAAHPAGDAVDPGELPEGRADPAAVAELARQEKRRRLDDLWAMQSQPLRLGGTTGGEGCATPAAAAGIRGNAGAVAGTGASAAAAAWGAVPTPGSGAMSVASSGATGTRLLSMGGRRGGSTGSVRPPPSGSMRPPSGGEGGDEEDAMQDEEVYVPYIRGKLQADMDRELWITPGERYAVEVTCDDPCLELSLRQVCAGMQQPLTGAGTVSGWMHVYYGYDLNLNPFLPPRSVPATGSWNPSSSTPTRRYCPG